MGCLPHLRPVINISSRCNTLTISTVGRGSGKISSPSSGKWVKSLFFGAWAILRTLTHNVLDPCLSLRISFLPSQVLPSLVFLIPLLPILPIIGEVCAPLSWCGIQAHKRRRILILRSGQHLSLELAAEEFFEPFFSLLDGYHRD